MRPPGRKHYDQGRYTYFIAHAGASHANHLYAYINYNYYNISYNLPDTIVTSYQFISHYTYIVLYNLNSYFDTEHNIYNYCFKYYKIIGYVSL